MQTFLTTCWFFITCLLIFYAAYFIMFKSHFCFVNFKSVLSFICLLLQFLNPVDKNHLYLQELHVCWQYRRKKKNELMTSLILLMTSKTPFYVNMSIFIRRMLCKLTAIFIWIIYKKIRQVKSSTLFSKLYLPIVRC